MTRRFTGRYVGHHSEAYAPLRAYLSQWTREDEALSTRRSSKGLVPFSFVMATYAPPNLQSEIHLRWLDEALQLVRI